MEKTLDNTMHHVGGVYQNAFSKTKIGILISLLCLVAGVTGYMLHIFIGGVPATPFDSLIALLSAFLFCVVFVLNVFFVGYEPAGHLGVFVSAIALGGFGVLRFDIAALVAIVLCEALLALGYHRGRMYVNELIKIRFFSVARVVIPLSIVAIAVVVSAAGYVHWSNRPLSEVAQRIVTPTFFEVAMNHASRVVGVATQSTVDFSLSLRDMARQAVTQALQQAGANGSTPVTASNENALVNKYISDFQKQFQGIAGGALDPEQPISTALYNGLAVRLDGLTGNTKMIAIGILTLTILLTLFAFMPLLVWVIGLVAYVFYSLLLAFGFGTIIYEMQNKETLVLP